MTLMRTDKQVKYLKYLMWEAKETPAGWAIMYAACGGRDLKDLTRREASQLIDYLLQKLGRLERPALAVPEGGFSVDESLLDAD